jgi:hypothetical protein
LINLSRKLGWSLSFLWIVFLLFGSDVALNYLDINLRYSSFGEGILGFRPEFFWPLLIGMAVIWGVIELFKENIDKE